MTTEERFKAAVNVIRNLPKNGSYQPSSAMMLQFYSYFKQATEGPCKGARPAFWDVVGRAKYDSWKALGDMSKEQAMNNYVGELRKIVETMSFTENVANFVGSISEIENIDVNDLDLIAPEAMKHARSRPGSPFASRDTSPQRPVTVPTMTNGHHHPLSDSDDEFNSADESDAFHHQPRSRRAVAYQQDSMLVQNINATVEQMQKDLATLQANFSQLERNLTQMKAAQKSYKHIYPKWWPWKNVAPSFVLFVILWPIVYNRIVNRLQRRK
ncbi:acyl-CoA-binding domain-containing protein 5-like [Culicoides brevitarsis]|uniref:acyl-CoA-binding domain-containing protein 5-like n=1 Tax=Culicoides brevitarsis TaxID=469753 RepID=UPI00307BF12D